MDGRWKRVGCVLAAVMAGVARGDDGSGTAPAHGALSERAQIFYYDWYGAPPFEGGYVHWGQGGHHPPGDVGANYYPKLGAYSSSDPAVLRQHMGWIREAGAGVLVLTWWGKDSHEDRNARGVMDAAAAAGLKVAFHLEPYGGQTAASVGEDVGYLLKTYGGHRAFYRAGFLGNRPIFYVFEALHHPAGEWRPVMDRLHAVEGGPLMMAQTSDLEFVKAGGFDGGYTYDGLEPFKQGAFLEGWKRSAEAFAAAGKLFIPSVGPGYWDDRAVPGGGADEPEGARTRDGGKGTTYARGWAAALEAKAPIVTITSFNEWHEGSQIEPAVRKEVAGYVYPGYGPGAGDGEMYLRMTAGFVRALKTRDSQ